MLKINIDFFENHPISLGKTKLCIKQYLNLKNKFSFIFEQAFKQKKIAVFIKDPQFFYFFLTYLDGIVDEVLILSQVFSKDDINRFLSENKISMCISDFSVGDVSNEITWININKIAASKNVFSACNEKKSTQWIIPTSGTTNTPKLIKHSTVSLTKCVKTDKEKGKILIWGNLYDHSRFAGIQVLLQSLLGGSTIILDDKSDIQEKLKILIENKCSALSGTPTFWRHILMYPSAKKLKLNQITLGGEIVDQAILNSLTKMFPNARITHVYALTEIGVAFSVSDSKAGFPIDFLNKKDKKFQLKISEKQTLLIKTKEEKINSYIKEKLDQKGYFDTQDIVKIDGDRVFFYGRDNKSINVGGHKVHPEEIEQYLLKHPQVKSVRILAKENSIVGNLIIAELVVDNVSEQEQSLLRKELKAYCGTQFPKYKVPYQFNFVQYIKYNKTGKIIRNGG